MNTVINRSLPILLCAFATPVLAEWQTNGDATLTSNYVWRGKTQSDDRPAVQAGVETRHSSGGYGGLWFSTIDSDDEGGGYELDFTLGQRFQAGPVPVDLGLIYYAYPLAEASSDVSEAYIGLGPERLQIRYAFTLWKESDDGDTHDHYVALGGQEALAPGYDLLWTIGHTRSATDRDEDYQHASLAVARDLEAKGVFSLGVEVNNADDDPDRNRPRLILAWQWPWTL